MSEEFPAQKLLQEFDAEEGRLVLLVVQCPVGENRKIRDEIITLAGGAHGAHVGFLNVEADLIRAIVGKNLMAPENTCQATEEMVRAFEDAGWKWG